MRILKWTAGPALALIVLAGCSDTPRTTTAAKMTDSDLERKIKSKLDSDPAVRDSKIDVSANADRNEATLSGTVPSQQVRGQAIELAKEANPGLLLTDRIDVKAREVSRTEYTEDLAREARDKAKSLGNKIGNSLDDAWIHTKIVTKLMSDADTPARKINVDVLNNVVTLRGTVESLEAKSEAERIARETDGVKRVNNLLKVSRA